jgi:hypothetical protein
MKYRAIVAALAVVLVPIAVTGAEAQRKADGVEKKICTVSGRTGSRLGGTTRCTTRAEREQDKAEARRTVDRIQAFKPTLCSPQPGC